MNSNPGGFCKGDPVRANRCKGIARVEKYIRSYGVYLLSRQMSVRFPGGDQGVDTFVPFWTFAPGELVKVEIGVSDERE